MGAGDGGIMRFSKETKGSAHPRWKGGLRVNCDGYLQITAGPLRGQYVQRLVLEAKLGRPLQADEEAHHINEDRLDCRPDNLEARPVDGANGHRTYLNGRPRWGAKKADQPVRPDDA